MPDKEYSSYISYTRNGSTEYVTLSVMSESIPSTRKFYFKASGAGFDEPAEAETLGKLLEQVEEHINVSDGKRSAEQINNLSAVTGSHYESVVARIEGWIDSHGEETKAFPFLKFVRG